MSSPKAKRLNKARKQKTQIAQTLGRLEAGEIKLVDLLTNPPIAVRKVRLWTVMCRAPKLGEAGVTKVLKTAKVWPETRLGALEEDDVHRILTHLPERAR